MHLVLITAALVFAMPITGFGWGEGSNLLLDPYLICRKSKRLHGKHYELCKNETFIMREISRGISMGFKECEHQFKHHRWNCTSIPHSMRKILQKDTRETSFILAITAAGVAYAVTRACTSGDLVECSCDKNHILQYNAQIRGHNNAYDIDVDISTTKQPNRRNHKRRRHNTNTYLRNRNIYRNVILPNGDWKWGGGCGDNVIFGFRKSKDFLDSRYQRHNDIRTLVRLHNNNAGRLIQATSEEVTIQYNKLHADPKEGETLDIALKKMKHRFVEGLSSSTADSLGLSRAILCNDSLVKRLQELQGTEQMYKGLVDHAKRMLKAHFDLIQTYQAFGNCFSSISVREPQPRASEAFRLFGEMHRNMEKDGVKMLKAIKPVLGDLGTYLFKAIPDTKLTIRRYADAKFAYLSYCLKVKEMDDEEHSFTALQEPIYRVETGNYEYRLILRCRQEARTKFAGLRSDVLEKMELLESKHARDLTCQLKRFISGLATLSQDLIDRLQEHPNLFPVEVDLKDSAFQYKSVAAVQFDDGIDDDGVEEGVELNESHGSRDRDQLISCFSDVSLENTEGEKDLLFELGLADVDLTLGSNSTQLQNFDPTIDLLN